LNPHVRLYDTTLRDGAQGEGVSFSVEDKLKIVAKLAELGIPYIEGGWPGSNPKDEEFFSRARGLKLGPATLVAFGSTCRPGVRPEEDPNLVALARAGTPVACIVGKAWDLQVTQVLETTLEENLRMIADSVAYLRGQGLRVFLDAEHFFDGYKENPRYALASLRAAAKAGAEVLVLCDTNGGSLPRDIEKAVRAAKRLGTPLGIHTHNDGELAVANSLAAVTAGAVQVQGTINGYGERCGNANLCSLIPALKLKLGIDCLTKEQLSRLTEVSRYVSEVANLVPHANLPYVGSSAFAHKAGLHVSALMKWNKSYQHIDPTLVGNHPRVLVSELSGRSNILFKAREKGFARLDKAQARQVLENIKALESRGFQYDGAEASFELLLHRAQPGYQSPFELVDFLVVVEKRRRAPSVGDEEILAEAMVKVKVGGELVHTAAEGSGPVHALDRALRQGLLGFYPALEKVKLVDYKVRILEESAGTEAQVRVLIESSDGEGEWRTVGASTNIIEASWQALVDSLEYWLWKRASA